MEKLTTLTEENKQNLLSKTFYVLPDNPSDKQFSASQIKKKGYEGLLVLFGYLNQIIAEMNNNVDINASDMGEKADISDSIIVIPNASTDISQFSVGQVFYVEEYCQLYKKGSNGQLVDLHADTEERYATEEEILSLFR